MKKTIALLSLFLFVASFINAQELDATVLVNIEQIKSGDRDRLERFKDQVQDYLNNTKFTKQEWDGEKIKCTFNIFFTTAMDELTYAAQVVVSSQRPVFKSQLSSLMLSVMDNVWVFKYEKGQAMYYNYSDYDPLTSFLDFYAFLIIGLDADSFEALGGSDSFQKAQDICAKGGSSQFPKGWQLESSAYNRRALVDNLLNAKYQQFRQDYFNYHYNGIDLYFSPQRKQAMDSMVRLIKNLEKARNQLDGRSVLLKIFFDSKAGEMIEYLRAYPDASIFDTLKKIDPSHAAKYDEALKTK